MHTANNGSLVQHNGHFRIMIATRTDSVQADSCRYILCSVRSTEYSVQTVPSEEYPGEAPNSVLVFLHGGLFLSRSEFTVSQPLIRATPAALGPPLELRLFLLLLCLLRVCPVRSLLHMSHHRRMVVAVSGEWARGVYVFHSQSSTQIRYSSTGYEGTVQQRDCCIKLFK